MWTSLIVLLVAALLTAGAAFWVLRAYRRAGGTRARSALIACGATSLVALGAYLLIGRPELPDAPYKPRLDALLTAISSGNPPPMTAEEHLAVWQHISREHPQDAIPHVQAADMLLALGRPREAVIEFEQALRRDPQSADALLGMGRSLVAAEGRVTPEAQTFFAQAAEHSDDPAPWLYQAMAAMEEGEQQQSQRFWREALARMSADDPRRAMAQRFASGEGFEE